MRKNDPIPIPIRPMMVFQHALVLPLLMLEVMGCGGGSDIRDERLVGVVNQAQQRQAEQNQEMARLNREVAEGSKRLVEADAKSREELLAMSREIQEQQNQLESHRQEASREVQAQHTVLEHERRELAAERWRESMLGPVISGTAVLLVCSLPLVLCWYLLHGLRHEVTDEGTLNELLVVDLTSDQPILVPQLPAAPAAPLIEHSSPREPKGPAGITTA